MKKKMTRKSPPVTTELKEAAATYMAPSWAGVVSVRTAKATLSSLLDNVEAGREVLITSDGRPKARLVSVNQPKTRKVFGGSADHLATMPAWRGGSDSTELISADRDGR